jgi:hypothetical protein
VINNFASSARTGRRNALPDIQSSSVTGGTSDLPLKLEALSVKEGNTSNLEISSASLFLTNLFCLINWL